MATLSRLRDDILHAREEESRQGRPPNPYLDMLYRTHCADLNSPFGNFSSRLNQSSVDPSPHIPLLPSPSTFQYSETPAHQPQLNVSPLRPDLSSLQGVTQPLLANSDQVVASPAPSVTVPAPPLPSTTLIPQSGYTSANLSLCGADRPT